MEDGSGDLTLRVIDLLCPIGKGPARSDHRLAALGKTIILQKIAKRIMEGLPRHAPHGAAHRRAARGGHRLLARHHARRGDLLDQRRAAEPRRAGRRARL
jgi:hypothetical protein